MTTKFAAALHVLVALATPGAGLIAQESPSQDFPAERLEQIVAPIALYPDNLITSVLMASTYPLEIVEADRWLDQNKGLTGPALETALKDQPWDPSVKSLVTVPDVLKRMSQNLNWTRDLGDAFLGQKTETMDAVQRMRGKANEAGNLKTTEQQTVTVNQDQTIVIEPTDPEVCYVPEYGTQAYGGGWAYPEPYYPYMYPAGWGLVGFGAGLLVGGALWGNGNWGWGHGDIDIDIDRYNNFGNRTNNNWSNRTDKKWNHRPEHRQGVRYRNDKVAERFGGKGGNRVPSDRARGRPSQLPSNRPGAGAGQRPGAGAGQRPGAGGAQRPSQRSSGAYSGASRPRTDRSSSYRGNSSRGGSRPSGGARGGGGGRGGRGGGRGGRR